LHIVSEKALKNFADNNAPARPAFESLVRALRKSHWGNLDALREAYPSADEVTVRSRKKVVVLNVGGNNWRVVAAFHYNTQMVFILKIMTHAEYSKEKWKQTL
jgi:mRNA interferase HigB